jgi:peptidoglycan/LPS O-acetylase OafA/YrhL
MARRILGCPPLRYLGKISYGFYVYHLAALYAAEKLLGLVSDGSRPAVFAAGLLLTVGAASLSYAILERPFLLLKERFAFVPSRPA